MWSDKFELSVFVCYNFYNYKHLYYFKNKKISRFLNIYINLKYLGTIVTFKWYNISHKVPTYNNLYPTT